MIASAIRDLGSPCETVSHAAYQAVTQHLHSQSKKWRDIADRLPAHLRSNRLTAAIGIMDHKIIFQALVAMRHATKMIAAKGSSWNDIINAKAATQEPPKATWEDDAYNRAQRQKQWDNIVREAARRAAEQAKEREAKRAESLRRRQEEEKRRLEKERQEKEEQHISYCKHWELLHWPGAAYRAAFEKLSPEEKLQAQFSLEYFQMRPSGKNRAEYQRSDTMDNTGMCRRYSGGHAHYVRGKITIDRYECNDILTVWFTVRCRNEVLGRYKTNHPLFSRMIFYYLNERTRIVILSAEAPGENYVDVEYAYNWNTASDYAEKRERESRTSFRDLGCESDVKSQAAFKAATLFLTSHGRTWSDLCTYSIRGRLNDPKLIEVITALSDLDCEHRNEILRYARKMIQEKIGDWDELFYSDQLLSKADFA